MVRTDLRARDQLVQTAHAAMAGAYAIPATDPYLVVLAVENAEALVRAANLLSLHDIKHVLFHEPDDDMRLTALATEPLNRERRRLLRRFRLWSD